MTAKRRYYAAVCFFTDLGRTSTSRKKRHIAQSVLLNDLFMDGSAIKHMPPAEQPEATEKRIKASLKLPAEPLQPMEDVQSL